MSATTDFSATNSPATYPPGPTLLRRLTSGSFFRQNGAEFMLANAASYGDIVHFRALGRHIFQFNHPEMVSHLLLRDAAKHHRGIVMQRSRFVLGDGLLTSEAPLHLRQRRLAQPAFHRQRIAAYGAIMAGYATEMTHRWQPGETRDLHQEMLLLTLRIVGKCLFDSDVEGEVRKISSAVDAFMSFLPLAFLPFAEQIQQLPIPAMRRIRNSLAEMDQLIYGMIAQRHLDPTDRGDLLSMLLASTDTEADASGSARMSDKQVRDECLTILLAGHETTANGLSFALWLLATHPDIQQALWEEVSSVLGSRPATVDDYPRLSYAAMVFSEAIRIYPPVWVTARTAAVEYEYRGFRIPAGSILLAPQVVLHRDPTYFPEPMRFDPLRFTESARAARPRFSYFPFGGGNRQCIGEGFAWMEAALVLATIIQHWEIRPSVPGQQLSIQPAITLRPKNGLPLTLNRRGQSVR